MIHHYDQRLGTYDGQTEAEARQNKLPELSDGQHENPDVVSIPEYWIAESEIDGRLSDAVDPGWFIGWRRITGTEKIRTVIATAIPRAAVGDSIFLILPTKEYLTTSHALLANLSSFALDFVCRQKIGGLNLLYYLFKQLPVFAPASFRQHTPWHGTQTLGQWIRPRVLELVYTSHDIAAFARTHNWDGPPFRWDSERRFLIKCELDAAFFHLYGIGRDDVAYVMDTFPVLRDDDETEHGEYRTKRVILALYDRLQAAIESGMAYETILNPAPADPRLAHPPTPPITSTTLA
jgi:hypothetical protein